MIFQLTARNIYISDTSRKIINRHIEKVESKLTNVNPDLVVLRLALRKNVDKYHPPRTHPHPHRGYSDLKPALASFEGSVTFRLNKKRFYAHFKGQTINECTSLGFERLLEEIEKYKDLHFSSESDYPDHSSIRGDVRSER